MIRIFPASEAPKIVRKYASSDEEVFLQARDFFHRNKDIRHHKVVVYDHEKPVFCLGFMKNNPTNVDKNHPQVQMQLSNFWEYSPDDEGLDYSYADRFELIIYHELEEYSYRTSCIL